MKAQIRKPVSGYMHYNDEYKQQAVERWQSSGRSAAKAGTRALQPARKPLRHGRAIISKEQTARLCNFG
jgi:hypothetical protein